MPIVILLVNAVAGVELKLERTAHESIRGGFWISPPWMGGACEQSRQDRRFFVRVNLMRHLLRHGIITSMQVLFITSMQMLFIHERRSAWLARISLLEVSLKSIIGNSTVSISSDVF